MLTGIIAEPLSLLSSPIQPDAETHQNYPACTTNASYKGRLFDNISDLLSYAVVIFSDDNFVTASCTKEHQYTIFIRYSVEKQGTKGSDISREKEKQQCDLKECYMVGVSAQVCRIFKHRSEGNIPSKRNYAPLHFFKHIWEDSYYTTVSTKLIGGTLPSLPFICTIFPVFIQEAWQNERRVATKQSTSSKKSVDYLIDDFSK